MRELSQITLERWSSGDYVGEAKPTALVEVRTGRFIRGYSSWDGQSDLRTRGQVEIWQPTWTPDTDWIALPQTLSCEIAQGFDNNGVATGTVEVDNVAYVEQGGYKDIVRGYFSPFRGFVSPARPQSASDDATEWYDILRPGVQIRVWEGYGDETYEVFLGLIDSVDPRTRPDAITIAARDMGGVLVDEQIFGWVKDPKLGETIRFIGEADSDGKKISTGATASSSQPGYPPQQISEIVGGSGSYWASQGHSTPAVTEWVELHLPEGLYRTFMLHPFYDGMEYFVSMYVRPPRDGSATVDGVDHAEGWVNGSGGDTVPGDNGGHTYLHHEEIISNESIIRHLTKEIYCGDNSVLRVSFRHLHQSSLGAHDPAETYRAGVRTMFAYKLTKADSELGVTTVGHSSAFETPGGTSTIHIKDISDIVRLMLVWGGFKEWEVSDTGTTLDKPFTINRQDTLMGVIQKCVEMTGFVFFMAAPTSEENSIGLPVFRPSHLFTGASGLEVSDQTVITGLRGHLTNESQAHVIRVLGGSPTDAKDVTTFGTGTAKAKTAPVPEGVYFPPWARAQRDAGVLRHVNYIRPELTTIYDCEIACLLIAFQQALASYTGVIEFPLWPGLELDDIIGAVDHATGINSRFYIAQRTFTYQGGENPSWVNSAQGSLLDHPDMLDLFDDYASVIAANG
ncbi:MAG: hypothetical protein QOJ29_890 [Thermoleophilaceae bacterium]|nr:hypothetical protein [Thermoleophilaceae bacterium]